MYNMFTGIRTYNVNIAQKIGLLDSIYLQAIMEIENEKGEPFRPDSAKIYIDYGIEVDCQDDLLSNLISNGLVEKQKGGKINVLPSGLLNLFKEQSQVAVAQPQKSNNKSDCIKQALLKVIHTDDSELKHAYEDWIDTMYAKRGYLTKAQVELFQQDVEAYVNDSIDNPQLAILQVAIMRGYINANWCINYINQNPNEFKRKKQVIPTVTIDTKNSLGNEVF